jgi:hypothetical protein
MLLLALGSGLAYAPTFVAAATGVTAEDHTTGITAAAGSEQLTSGYRVGFGVAGRRHDAAGDGTGAPVEHDVLRGPGTAARSPARGP